MKKDTQPSSFPPPLSAETPLSKANPRYTFSAAAPDFLILL